MHSRIVGGYVLFSPNLTVTTNPFGRYVRSIRIPASFNGLYGLRPSYHRVPYRGALNSLEGQDSLPSVLGPLSHSMSGIKVFMKAVIDAKPWRKDPLAVHKPWDQQEYELIDHGGGRELVFAILWNDGNVTPNPPIIRALEVTKKALIAAGHKGVSFVLSKLCLFSVLFRVKLSTGSLINMRK
jgi:amidase